MLKCSYTLIKEDKILLFCEDFWVLSVDHERLQSCNSLKPEKILQAACFQMLPISVNVILENRYRDIDTYKYFAGKSTVPFFYLFHP